MPSQSPGFVLIALPAALASFGVLWLAEVGASVWILHMASIGLAAVLAGAGRWLSRTIGTRQLDVPLLLIALVGLAAPLAGADEGPARWLSLGSLNLYVAPVVLPMFLVACARALACSERHGGVASLAVLAALVLLSMQPDFSQGLAVLVGATLTAVRTQARSRVWSGAVMLGVPIVLWASSRPDPLLPVPHVEGVFALAFGQSMLAGLGLAAAALVLVLGLVSVRTRGDLVPVAAYYAVLCGCSLAGLTPAPLIGFGAGPWLGFGLLAVVAPLPEPDGAKTAATG